MSIYISDSLYVGGGVPYVNENNPVVGWHSFLTPADITVTGTTSNRPASNMWTPDTATTWEGQPYNGVPSEFVQYVELANSDLRKFNYVGIARHNLIGFTVNIQGSTDSATWVDLTTQKMIASETPILEYFSDSTYRYVRIRISKTDTNVSAPIIAHVKMGEALVLQRRIYVGHRPATINKLVKKKPLGSENGQYLGQVVIRSYHKSMIEQENNSPSFVREKIKPFLAHVNGHTQSEDISAGTFFYAWRPSSYPDEVVYGWSNDEVMPENAGGDTMGGRMSWSMNIEAIA